HFARNQFDNLAKVGRLQVPVVVVCGMTDDMIPIDVARSLFNRVPPPKLMLETNAGHDDRERTSPGRVHRQSATWITNEWSRSAILHHHWPNIPFNRSPG